MERRVFFPWEKRPLGLLGRRGLHVRALVGVALLLGLLWWLHSRERYKADVRVTRAAIATAHVATDHFRADHQGQCPSEAVDLVAGGYLREIPTDAWGAPLRIECTAKAGESVEVAIYSDGPDGFPQGLDRVR